MNRKLGLLIVSLFICNLTCNVVRAANVLQVKGNSAILELSDSEFEALQPGPGKKIRLQVNGKDVPAVIKKLSNKKILINTNGNLVGTKSVQVAAGGSSENKSGTSQKKWLLGANLQYVTGSSSITITSLAPRNLKYSGFDISGVGMYYFDAIGVGGRADYTFGNGTTEVASDKVTLVDFSLLGEYKFKTFSLGVMLVAFSNLHDTDTLNNDNSLNASGLGYGVFATYDIYKQVKLLLNYKTINYKLDPASYSTSDIRFGAGYYF